VTTSHIGIGDIATVTLGEKIYATFVMILTTFLYAALFGNIASFVEDFIPKYRKIYENNYRNALNFLKDNDLEDFVKNTHNYYTSIWTTDRGNKEK